MRGQVPETTCNEARTKSAIKNYQAQCYVRAEREWRARVSAQSTKGGAPEAEYLVLPQTKTPLAGVT